MRLYWRVGASAMLACFIALGCREASTPASFDRAVELIGRNPVSLITSDDERHLVYVDPKSRALVHQRVGEAIAQVISHPGEAIDLRGENAPVFLAHADGSFVVVYPVVRPGGSHHGASALFAQSSRDRGRHWSVPVRVDGDDKARSHNFTDCAAARDGKVVCSWLDSRAGQQGVQTAVLRSDLTVAPARTADPKTCQCCRTALYAATSGDLWLAYRDLAEGKVRNMAYAVSTGADQPFVSRGDVADDRWSVDGCPESGPRFAETTDGKIWLAWFNGATNAIELAAAPRGGSFAKRAMAITGGVNHPDLGTLPDGRLAVFYEAFRDGKRAIEARVSDRAFTRWSNAITLAPDGSMPRYVRQGEHALLTWTIYSGETPRIRVVDPLPLIAP